MFTILIDILLSECDGAFGPGCLTPCNCEVQCDSITGDCHVDCLPGKKGFNCQVGVLMYWFIRVF